MKAIACMLALAMPFSAVAEQVTIPSAAGEVNAPMQPKPVVVLDLAAIDTLAALDVTVDGVPDIKPPAYLAQAMTAPTVGSLFEPDFESIAAMAPQLIVAGGRSQGQVKALSAIAPTLDMTIPGEDLVAEAESRLAAYGAIFGRQERAKALQTQLEQRLEAATNAVAGKGDALILMTNGGKISAYGGHSRFGWLHQRLGLPEARPGMTAANHGEAVSFEFVADVDPDWLLVIDRGAAIGQSGEAAAATLDNPLIAGTTAAQKGQIVYLDSAAMYLSGGGYQATMMTLDQMIEVFSAAADS